MTLSTPLLLRRAILHRRGRLVTALTGLTLSATIVTALATLYADVGDKLNHSFATFGPNVLLDTHNGAPLPEDVSAKIDSFARIRVEVIASGAVIARANGANFAVIGTDITALPKMYSAWQLTRISEPGTSTTPAIFGRRAFESLGKPPTATLVLNGATLDVVPVEQFTNGGPEEDQIYIPASAFTAWSHQPMTTLEARIPGSATEVNAAIRRITAGLPQLEVHPVRQLVEGQGRVVEHTRALIFSSAAIIIATIAIAIIATLSAMVLDRGRDYAVMKALGCPASRLHRLFLAEILTLALAGAVCGIFAGLIAATAIGELNFHTRINVHPALLPFAFAVNLLVAAIAAAWPMRALAAVEPAALLRGE